MIEHTPQYYEAHFNDRYGRYGQWSEFVRLVQMHIQSREIRKRWNEDVMSKPTYYKWRRIALEINARGGDGESQSTQPETQTLQH